MAEKRLTKEIAEESLADPELDDEIELSGFTELDDDAAESLRKFEGILFLTGLTSLSDAAAERLRLRFGKYSTHLSKRNLPDSIVEILSRR